MSKETTMIADSPTEGEGAGATTPVSPEPEAASGQAPVDTAAERDTIAAPPLSAAEIEALQARASKADESRDRYLRAAADFENFKKRAARERQEAVRFANEALLGKLVSVLDSFEMALAADANAASASGESFRAGVAMIHGQLRSALVEAGLEEVNAAGQPFNPNLHEAVAQHESAEVPEGHVFQQLRRGYKYRDRLLRPASVVVAKPPATPAAPDAPTAPTAN